MDPFVQRNKRYLEIEQWHQSFPNLIVGFSTRDGGEGTFPYSSLNLGFHVGDDPQIVKQNRQRLAEDLGIPLCNWVGTEQVHEAVIHKVTTIDRGFGSDCLETAIKRTDGIYTREKNILLTSLYADCVPLYFFSPKDHVVGLAHAGWRGTVQNIGPAMINKWTKEENVPVEHIHVAIGPCISSVAYEVDQKVVSEVENVWPSHIKSQPYQSLPNGKFLLDLREVNKQLLIQAGVREEQIILSSICTANDVRMFSHRAEEGKTGRLMSFIGFKTGW
ncbi:hypothetical protein JCM9140_75 [Halalkalibacter wakoensis JCM 9140]|uniref:Purine nucleoside phosphorylase n=1 Tax=Halalkalibacter wakoensis JCM 9140 TaxID=1236970 RepID=W4PWU1_9BACI|nr:peptidoglycan editing factor PgeF [Halalkalibacter wakoensis]GAE24165.1 hypothetical protein JCM9140_75 [Halalkalibacter wakoensis JCM 9140]